MTRFKERKVVFSDLATINRWIKDYDFIYQRNLISKKNISDLKLIISDNIRIGLKYRNFYFFSPFALFKKKYFLYQDISKHLKNRIHLKNSFFYKNFNKSKYLFKDLKLKNKTEKINITNKILLLGPKKRNLNILEKLKKSYKIKNINNRVDLSYIKQNKINFIISSGYPYKINDMIVSHLKNKIINLHATFLPWGKGIGTTFFSILLRQPTGISIHFIDKKFDTGSIILRKEIKFSNNDTTRTFYSKLLRELDLVFLNNYTNILNSKIEGYVQKSFSTNTPYLSRDNFEKIIEILPNGYDTKMLDLLKLSNIFQNNIIFLKKFS